MAKKENASFEGEKQRTPVRFQELADAVALLEAHHYIKSYTSPAQLGLSDSDFGTAANDFTANMAKINAATKDAFDLYMYMTQSSAYPNLRACILNKLSAEGFGLSTANTGNMNLFIRRNNSIYNHMVIDVMYEPSTAGDQYCYSTLYNYDSNGTDRTYPFQLSKSRYGFLEKCGGVVTGATRMKKSAPAWTLENEDGTKVGFIKMFDTGTMQVMSADAENGVFGSTNTAQLLLYPADVISDIAKRLIVGWDGSVYKIYGEHNKDSIVLGTSIKMTPAGETTRSREIAKLYADSDTANNYGDILVIGAAGDTYVGAGESAAALYNVIGATASENMYVCADNNLYLYAACNTIANRKGLCLSSGAFNPVTDAGFILGSASYRWGQIYSSASSISTSDRNEKHDVDDLDPGEAMKLILGLRPVSYKFNNGTSGRTHSGMIAQDVEELLNELGISTEDCAAFIKSPLEKLNLKTGQYDPVTDETGQPKYRYGLRYEEFIAPLIKTVQEQQKMIDRLEERIAKLEERLGGEADVANA